MSDPTPTHLSWPPRLVPAPGGVTFAEVEQGTTDEILQGVGMVCELRPGDLPWDDDLGIPRGLGSTDPEQASAQIDRAVSQIETRRPITVEVIDTADGRTFRPRIVVDDEPLPGVTSR